MEKSTTASSHEATQTTNNTRTTALELPGGEGAVNPILPEPNLKFWFKLCKTYYI